MPFIAFLGCDGSGKSAVLDRLTDRFQMQGWNVVRGHWRPVATTLEKPDTSGADDPHGKQPRGGAASFAKLGWLWLNWWIGWLGSLRQASRSGVVLFDRYHADLLVDPRRYRYGGPMWIARGASRLMPQPDLVIFLDADPDTLLSRKQEVGREALQESRNAYLQLAASNPKVQVVDASKPLTEVVDAVDALIRGCSPEISDKTAVCAALSAVEHAPGVYALLCRNRRALLALPDNRSAANHALRLYQPQRWKARFIAALMRWIVTAGIHQWILPRLHHPGGKPRLEPTFDGCLPGTAGVMLGSPEHRVRRAILSYETASGREVAKLAFGEAGKAVIESEASAIDSMPDGLPGLTRYSGVHHGKDFSILRMPYVTGTPLPQQDTSAALGLLQSWFRDNSAIQVTGFPEWPAILSALNDLTDSHATIDQLARLQLKPAVRHGDFARWNLLRRNDGSLMALDWEWAHPAGMPCLDLIHLYLQDARLVERLAPDAAIRKTIEVLGLAPSSGYLEKTGWGAERLLPVIASLAFKQGAGHQDNAEILATAVAMTR
jgi:thymidylate kinase